jgi:Fuc2NAc and GlcNAc transferase
VAATVLMFLHWNLPGSRLFMGDAGASFLGSVIGLLLLLGWQLGTQVLLALLVLYGVFVVDASLTLLGRLLRGKNCFSAHSSHLFQQLARRHGTVAVLKGLLLINLGWLLPLATLLILLPDLLPGLTQEQGSAAVWLLLALAYAPLVTGYLFVHDSEQLLDVAPDGK